MKKETIQTKESQEIIYGNKYKLDSKDLQIIKILYKNSRLSFSDISKQVKLSRDAVRYRIKKMVENDVIQGFFPLINPPKLGFTLITIVLISLQKSNLESEQKLNKYLKSNKYISNFASLVGKWDYFFTVTSKDLGHFDLIIKDIRDKFPEIINNYEICNVIQTYKVSMYNNLLD